MRAKPKQYENRPCEWCGRKFLTRKDKHQRFCCHKCHGLSITTAPASEKVLLRFKLMKSDVTELNRLCEHLECFRSGILNSRKPSVATLLRSLARGELLVMRRGKD